MRAPMLGFEDRYEVCDSGKIFHKNSGDEKYTFDKKGYKHFKNKVNGKNKQFSIHRVVWEAFNGLIPDGLVVDHINHKRDDNRLCNLQLLTPRENSSKSLVNKLGLPLGVRAERGSYAVRVGCNGFSYRVYSTPDLEKATRIATIAIELADKGATKKLETLTRRLKLRRCKYCGCLFVSTKANQVFCKRGHAKGFREVGRPMGGEYTGDCHHCGKKFTYKRKRSIVLMAWVV